jgi:dienelactone hydrolase
MTAAVERPVSIPAGEVLLRGGLTVPDDAPGVVVFAHGSGSGRHSPRNRFVADALVAGGLGTLLIDLLSEEEERADRRTGHLRFDIDLLARRVTAALDWVAGEPGAAGARLGVFGASTGAAAGLVAAAARPDRVTAIVSRGGRPDLAGDALPAVRAPTLLIVGGEDTQVLALNLAARRRMRAPVDLEVVPDAGHLFEEPGALALVAELALSWLAARWPSRRAS